MEVTLQVAEFENSLELETLDQGRGFLTVESSDCNRPGLQFSGFFVHFAFERIQVFGNAEIHYLNQMEPELLSQRAETFMRYDVPALIFANGWTPLPALLEAAKRFRIPAFKSEQSTTSVTHSAMVYLDRVLAPTITRHGVLLDVYGVGVMLMGESGLGKSEAALEMIKRGHRLVADDVVEITRVTKNRVSGTAPELTRHLMEIRGIGLIDVRYMYGVGAVINEKSIDIVIEMELWQDGKAYERLGLEESSIELLGVKVPRILMPVRPGRNMAIVIEVAARNFRLKRLGYDAAKEFDKRWSTMLKNKE